MNSQKKECLACLQTFANRLCNCKLLRTKKLVGFGNYAYLCTMISEILTSGLMLTSREWFLLIIGMVVYAVLFVVTVQNSRRKVLALQDRLERIRTIQEQQEAQSQQSIQQNEAKIRELEGLLRKLGDENSLLRLELEEKKATLDYNNKVARLENEKRQQAETAIFSSAIYHRVQESLNSGQCLNFQDWSDLEALVNSIYTGFTEKLYSLYRMTVQEYHVSLLIKVRIQPKDIALLTSHSKESVASTRSRLFSKVFGRKGSSKDWDDFILSL